jgi:CheY-like chemotaxis protein
MTRKVVAAVTDLFFVAKIESAGRQAGVKLLFAKSIGDLLEEVQSGADLVVLDLNDSNLDWLGALGRLRGQPETAAVPTLAYFSHVDADLARQAREAGCARVVPRSQFSSRLVDLLRDHTGESARSVL